ncbi:MAG: hypothetical protein AAF501_01750 [Pseudomonadota bacterium]
MSGDGERRSMDDVMASIRRIIRSEKSAEPEPTRPTLQSDVPVPAPPEPEAEEEVFSLTTDMMEEVEDAVEADVEPDVDDGPADFDPATLRNLAGVPTAEKAVEMPPLRADPEPEPEPVASVEAVEPDALDPEPEPEAGPEVEPEPEIEAGPDAQTVPVVPLAQGDVVTEPAEDAEPEAVMLDEAALESMVRRILREELMGEIGQNISANVTRMIETEVSRRLTGPK